MSNEKLLEKVREGCEESRDKVFIKNKNLIHMVANKMHSRWKHYLVCIDREDLVQEGAFGLMRAIEGYNPSNGTKFSTYAATSIKRAIERHIYCENNAIKFPRHLYEKMPKFMQFIEDYKREYRCSPSIDDICTGTGWTKELINNCYKLLDVSCKSIDAPISDTISLQDVLPGTDAPELKDESLLMVLKRLPERRRKMVIKRFGLDGGEPMTLEEVGKEFGISREAVNQQLKKAYASMKKQLLKGL